MELRMANLLKEREVNLHLAGTLIGWPLSPDLLRTSEQRNVSKIVKRGVVKRLFTFVTSFCINKYIFLFSRFSARMKMRLFTTLFTFKPSSRIDEIEDGALQFCFSSTSLQ